MLKTCCIFSLFSNSYWSIPINENLRRNSESGVYGFTVLVVLLANWVFFIQLLTTYASFSYLRPSAFTAPLRHEGWQRWTAIYSQLPPAHSYYYIIRGNNIDLVI